VAGRPIPPPAREIGRSARGARVATLFAMGNDERRRDVVWLIGGYAVSLLTLWHKLDQCLGGLLLLAVAVEISRRPAVRP